MFCLPVDDQTTIKLLARADVEVTMAGLKPFIKSARWIGETNQYASNVISELKNWSKDSKDKKRELAQYIAASAVLHANDGWSYLGRAISCLMVGDPHRALHLAYYAELRACMSLLAGVGIGIFNHSHYVIDAPDSTKRLNSPYGTHEVVWLALEFWSRQPASGSLFTRLIRPEGISLDDWFAPIGGVATLAAQAHDWFIQWGMDLNFTIDDRNARNESSYRPDGIPLSWEIPSTDVLEFTKDLWLTLEPSDQSSFEQVDQHILRLALGNQFHGLTGEQPSDSNPNFVAYIAKVVQMRGLPESATRRWIDFLLRRRVATDPQIFTASGSKPANAASDPIGMLSRAVLLLRVATGSAHDLLKQAGFDTMGLSFWWGAIGAARGLWKPSTPPDQLKDLWADIYDTLLEVGDVSTSDPAAFSSINGLVHEMGGPLSTLCSHERVGLWGLCST